MEDLPLQVPIRQDGERHPDHVVRGIVVLQPGGFHRIGEVHIAAVYLPQLQPLPVYNLCIEELVCSLFPVQSRQDRALWGLDLQHQVEYPVSAEGRLRRYHSAIGGDRPRQIAAEGVHHCLL